jgi:hypothetical protein
VFVGSETENYLRYLQSAGIVRPYPWSVRSFSPAELDRLVPTDSAHPWSGARLLASDTTPGRLRVGLVAPRVAATFNSSFPYGSNDGPIWAGKGLTSAVEAGFWARFGPLSLVVAPLLFRAENGGFDLYDNGRTGPLSYGDPQFPHEVDLPQRFGDGAYTRLDPGQSTLRVELPFVVAGVSTANQQWGPASEHPVILGNNAGGFLHAFLGTPAPVNLWIGRAHGRVVWGRLSQSGYTDVGADTASRLMTGVVATFTPRGVPGLEVGAARFYHSPWPEGGISGGDLLKPFEGILKEDVDATGMGPDGSTDVDNQLFSVFMRWVFAPAGLEVYGEFGREDHNWDFRDLVLEPDQQSAYTAGFRKLWLRPESRALGLRGEVMNSQVSHLIQARPQGPFYRHTMMRQGHTNRGQILGSPAGLGGAGAMLAADYFHPDGRWTVSWSRELRLEDLLRPEGRPRESDVLNGVGVEALLFRRGLEITTGVRGVYEINRNFGSDAFNLNATMQVRVRR